MAEALARARAAWGDALPEWVAALAQACDDGNQASAARAIGYSAPTVSQVLKAEYKGDLKRLEEAVCGAFMDRRVECPGLRQSIPTNECLSWQRRRYDGGNHLSVRMYRACRGGCPHSRLTPPQRTGDDHG